VRRIATFGFAAFCPNYRERIGLTNQPSEVILLKHAHTHTHSSE
jgi:hypothetical protein